MSARRRCPPRICSRSFTRRPSWQRIAVLLAGPAFNILFAVLLLWGMFWVSGLNEVRPRIGEVTADSIAARAGLKSGDEIVSVDGVAVAGQRDVVLGLLDGVSSRAQIVLGVRGSGGAAAQRSVRPARPRAAAASDRACGAVPRTGLPVLAAARATGTRSRGARWSGGARRACGRRSHRGDRRGAHAGLSRDRRLCARPPQPAHQHRISARRQHRAPSRSR